jgi:hypothetical protein
MPDICTYVLWVLLFYGSFCTIAAGVQSQASSPNVVLEVISTNYGIGGHQDKELLIRLTDDGKVEWDNWLGNTRKRETSAVNAKRVSEVQRALDGIDSTSVRNKKMGPYHIYMDTSVVLQIQMHVRQEQVTFSVTNPWPSNMPSEVDDALIHKAMPKNVKVVVCEIDRLSSGVRNTPVSELCKTRNESH